MQVITPQNTPELHVPPNVRVAYEKRIDSFSNPTARKLLEIIVRKQTNMCVAADVTSCKELISLIHQIGNHICMLKTHIDIIHDFHPSLIKQLREFAQTYDFLIFEDRKFADIGNTVKHQYAGGVYHIADWADIINAHTIPGPGIIQGLKEVGYKKNRALVLLPQMSSAGNLANGEYTQKTVAMAQQEKDFVIGFIARNYLDGEFLHFTPGVKMQEGGDGLGQQYITPEKAIQQGSDVLIVGRGIYQSKDPGKTVQEYKKAGWDAYQSML